MSDDLIIELNNTSSISISQDSSFEDFVAQFQTSCSKLLSIVNGKQLHYYDNKAELPIGLKFEYKRKNKGCTAYYFRDIANNTHCVFGRSVALLFYNRLDEVDPGLSELSNFPDKLKLSTIKHKAIVIPINDHKTRINTNNAATRIIRSKCPTEIIIIDCGQKYSFPYINFNIETTNHDNK